MSIHKIHEDRKVHTNKPVVTLNNRRVSAKQPVVQPVEVEKGNFIETLKQEVATNDVEVTPVTETQEEVVEEKAAPKKRRNARNED